MLSLIILKQWVGMVLCVFSYNENKNALMKYLLCINDV